ncbi:hypothetical protein SAFG77S_11743 [Streptomyces afghaniensis]
MLYCAGLVLLLALLDAAQTVLTGTVDARSTAWLRHRLTGHVLGVGPAADRFGSGDLVARLVGNAAEAGTTPAARAALLAALAGPLGGVVALGLIDWRLAAVFLAGAPVLTFLLRAVARDTTESATRYQRTQGRIAAALAEAVEGFRTVRAAGTEGRETARVLRPLPGLSEAGHRMWRVQGRAAAQAVAVAPLLQLGVVAVAGVLLTRDRLSVGEVLAASRYAVLATGVGVLVGRLAGLARARAAARRLGEIRAEPATGFGERRLPDGPGRLELRGVTARRGGRTVLDGVDLVVPGGTTLAVVGRSGAGKSLLASLAGRLADPDAARCSSTVCRSASCRTTACGAPSATPSPARPSSATRWSRRSASAWRPLRPTASARRPARPSPTTSSAASPTDTTRPSPTPRAPAAVPTAGSRPGVRTRRPAADPRRRPLQPGHGDGTPHHRRPPRRRPGRHPAPGRPPQRHGRVRRRGGLARRRAGAGGGRHEELWRLAEYRAVFGEGAEPAPAGAGSGAEA